jgi:hypothetical protein
MISGGGCSNRRPHKVTRPEVGMTNPAMICNKVDLPQPDGPTIDTKDPRSIPSETPPIAFVVTPCPTNAFETSLTKIYAPFCDIARLIEPSGYARRDRPFAS